MIDQRSPTTPSRNQFPGSYWRWVGGGRQSDVGGPDGGNRSGRSHDDQRAVTGPLIVWRCSFNRRGAVVVAQHPARRWRTTSAVNQMICRSWAGANTSAHALLDRPPSRFLIVAAPDGSVDSFAGWSWMWRDMAGTACSVG